MADCTLVVHTGNIGMAERFVQDGFDDHDYRGEAQLQQ